MMDMYELGTRLFGRSRAEDESVLTDATTRTYIGNATSDSSDGSVYVELSDDVTMPDDYDGENGISVELPTTAAVSEGDEVVVTVFGGGAMKSPVVTGVVGSGDRIAGVAQDALDVANATGQHFWSDDDGAHVTEVTQEEWSDPTDPGYQSGPNSLWNSLGMLFRDGLANLMALLAGRTDASITFTGAQSEYGYGRYAMPINTRTVTSVLADGVSASFTLTRYGAYVELEVTAPAATSEIEVSYTTDSAVGFFFNGRTTAEIGPSGMTLARDFDGTSGSASIDFFEGRGRVYATAEGVAGETGASQGITIDTGVQAATQTASVSVDSGDSGSWVTITTNHNDQRYFFPVLQVGQSGSADEIYLKASTLSLDYGSVNPTGGPFDFAMADVIDMLTTASVTLSRGSGAASWASGQVRRSGKVVVVTLVNMKLAAALSSGSNSPAVTNIPAGYRPNVLQRVPVALGVNGNYANVWGVVGAGGNIQIHNGSGLSIPTTAEISLNCAYIID